MSIADVVIISVDKTDEVWHVEGEAAFEGNFSTAFAATFYPAEEEIDGLEFVVPPADFDRDRFAEMLVAAISDFDE